MSKRKSNLRIIWHSVAPFVRSGYGNVTRYVTTGIKKAGYNIMVSSYYGIEPGGILQINNVPIVASKRGQFGSVDYEYYFKSTGRNLGILMCFDKETEVLTEDNGWKYIRDLDKEERIVQYNFYTGKLEYIKPAHYFVYDYNDKLYHVSGRDIDLMVTPNHKILVKRRDSTRKNEYIFEFAHEVFDKRRKYLKISLWQDREFMLKNRRELAKLFNKRGFISSNFKTRIIRSKTKEEADRIQELSIKAGYAADLYKESSGWNKGNYIVSIKKGIDAEVRPKYNVGKNEYINYKGFIYGVACKGRCILIRRNGKVVITGQSNFWAFCYDEKTELLTEEGFKFLKDLEYTNKIATLNKDGYLEYQYPIDIQHFQYNGKMFKISNSNQIDLMVTPEHRLYVKIPDYDRNKLFRLVSAKEVFSKTRAQFKKDAKWIGRNPKYFIIPKYTNEWKTRKNYTQKFHKDKLLIDIKDWLEFLGYYLSEGNTDGNSVVINQTSSQEKIKKIESCLKKFPIRYKRNKNGFYFCDVQLASYLKSLGYHATTKFIPKEIKELSSNLLKIFLDAYILGDGTENNSNCKSYTIYTSSEKMRDDLQEIILKAGYGTNYTKDDRVERITKIGNQEVIAKHISYGVSMISSHLNPTLFKKRGNKSKISSKKWVDYSGIVYCCSVPNEVIFVRRNGKTCWCGNSWFPKTHLSCSTSPLDHEDYPPELQAYIKEYDYLVSLCKWTQSELAKFGCKSTFIPHGVNLSIFKPMDKDKARKITGLPRDKFIFGNVAANCFDTETEVLTRNGWKGYENISKDDNVLTLDNNGYIIYQKPEEIIKQNYKGKMYRLKTKYLDFLVTPNHRMYFRRRKYSKKNKKETGKYCKWLPYKREEINKIFGKRVWYKKGNVNWIGKEEEYFELPEYNKEYWRENGWDTPYKLTNHKDKRLIKMNNFLVLLGYYISEGNSNGNTVFISQIKKKKEMIENLKRLSFNIRDYEDKIGINDVQLATWFKNKIGNGASKKYIPIEFKQLSKRQLEILWNALCLGDGWVTQSSKAYSTTSLKLAGDIQEILLKLGDCGDIYFKKPRDGFVNGRIIKKENCKICFVIHRNKVVKEVQNRVSLNKCKNVEKWIDYDGKVWCITIPNHIVYTRRNGKVCFSSQSDKESRKSHYETLDALKQFRDNNPDVKDILYCLHSNPLDPRGISLQLAVKKRKLEDIVKLENPFMANVGISEEELAILYNNFDIFLCPSKREGFGMCLTPDTTIITEKGLQKIEDLNSHVLTYGIFEEAIQSKSRYIDEDIFKIKVWGYNKPLGITKKHPILAIKRQGRKITLGEPDWIYPKELSKGDLIVMYLPLEHSKVNSFDLTDFDKEVLSDKDNVWYKMGYSQKSKEFPIKYPRFIKIDKDFMKLIGLYIAEGSTSKKKLSSIEFSLGNEPKLAEEIVTLIKKIFNKRPTVKHYKNKIRISLSGKIIAKFLSTLCGLGSHNKFIHKDILYQKESLIETLIDYIGKGDGHINKRGYILFHMSSSKLLDDMYLLSLRLGYKVSRSNNKNLRIIKSKNRTHGNKIFYKDNKVFFLIKNIKIEPYQGFVYNIQTPSAMYSTLTGAVHNCFYEAMSCGVPCIGHSFSAMIEAIKGRGWLARTKMKTTTPINAVTGHPDVDDIERCIYDSYFNSRLREKYSRKSRKFALGYSWESAISKWIDYLELIEADLTPKDLKERKLI